MTRLSTAERAAWLMWAWSAAILAIFLTARGETADQSGDVLLFKALPPNAGAPTVRVRRRAGRQGKG